MRSGERRVHIAGRNIVADRRRLGIATIGVGRAMALMLLLRGAYGAACWAGSRPTPTAWGPA